MTIPVLPAAQKAPSLPLYAERDARLREAANQLEATFLAEMLKSAGFGDPRESYGGGIGEDQFSSFLRDAQAENMVKAGGIGLAEALFEAMKARLDVS
jgi:Rod binding domain-containing protein